MSTPFREAFIHNWKTTLVGLAQLVNGAVPAVMVWQEAIKGVIGPEAIKHLSFHMATFLMINGVLQAMKGILSKQVGTGSDRPQPIVDAKLANIPPFEQSPK